MPKRTASRMSALSRASIATSPTRHTRYISSSARWGERQWCRPSDTNTQSKERSSKVSDWASWWDHTAAGTRGENDSSRLDTTTSVKPNPASNSQSSVPAHTASSRVSARRPRLCRVAAVNSRSMVGLGFIL